MGRKLFVEVCNAADLMPKDGQGSANPFCTIEFDGQKKKTETKQKDLNPAWNSVHEFTLFDKTVMENETLEVCVYSEKRGVQRKPGFLGRVRLPGRSFVKKGEEALVYYPLERRSMFSHVKGELGLKVWYSDETDSNSAGGEEESPQTVAAEEPAAENPPQAEADDSPSEAEGAETAEAAPEAAAEAEVPAPATVENSPVAAEPPVVDEVSVEESKPAEDTKKDVKVVEEKPEAAAKEVKVEHTGEPREEKEEKKKEEKKEKKEERKEAKVEKEEKEEKKDEEKEERKEEKKENEEGKEGRESKKEGKQQVKRVDAAPTIVITKMDEPPKKLQRASTVPSSDFHLKETKPPLARGIGERVVSYDLVEKMHYLFVKVVKARGLVDRGSGSSYTRIIFGSLMAKTKMIGKTQFPEWHEVFAFSKENSNGPAVEVSIWDAESEQFLGAVGFDLQEIPTRVPPDSPLAPQWYRLENIVENAENNVRGDIMLSVWWGTQADEAFTESWQSDSGGFAHTRAKVYLSPKLWYLRVNIIEAQEVQPTDKTRFPEVSVKAQLGFQAYRTKVAANRNTSPFWNEDLIFVAAEPFEDDLILIVQNKTGNANDPEETLGVVKISLTGIERRTDHRLVNSRWYNLDRYDGGEKRFHGRLHLRVCFDGGYHVRDESTHYTSCVRPTARQLWRPVVGVLELGIIRGKDVLPMKTKDGRGTTDAYCVAKYGQKWVRTRTVVDSLNPRWNEQYSWEVYDPCTVLTVGMFDNCHVHQQEGKDNSLQDQRIGKVRIRISTLESERVYSNSHPLLMLQRSGVRKMGEIELAVRYSSASLLNVMSLYFKPLLPKMHYLHPLGVTQSEILRISAMRLVAMRLVRSEPPLRQEVVQYMLDSDSHVWSLRRSKVNYYRIMNLLSGPIAVASWFHNICQWKHPVTTMLVHVLFLILVMYPELVLPTLFLYLALIGAWHYRYRPRSPASMDAKLSQAEYVEPDELDEEFDLIPTSKDPGVVKARYDRLRIVSARIQNVLGDIATQGERLASILSWRDPRASGILVATCMAIAILLYVIPLRAIIVVAGLYVLRHPRFRDPMPSRFLNFFRRLPSLADRIL